MEIRGLLTDLQNFGVESFKGYGIEVTFRRPLWSPTPAFSPELTVPGTSFEGASAPVTQPTIQPTVDLADPGLAQSLDAEMPADKILHWSSSPEPELPTPLAGEELLTSEG